MLVSIQLNSNRPERCRIFLDYLERNTISPQAVEIRINIDEGDAAMRNFLEQEKQRRPFAVHYLESPAPQSFFDLWKPLNRLLETTHPEAYFIANVSDEFLFETKGWDEILARYAGYYPDHIFRLRASRFRFRNYTDIWQCGFAPDCLAFHTRRWLEIVGCWSPCFGPDSFQQCVAYYLSANDPFNVGQISRDIPMAELRFSGEGDHLELTGRNKVERIRGHIRAWFVLMSHPMIEQASRAAALLRAHIANPENYDILDAAPIRAVTLVDGNKRAVVKIFPYGLSKLRVRLRNIWRMVFFAYYSGKGRQGLRPYALLRGMLLYPWAKYDGFADFIESLVRRLKLRQGIY